jgi:hypothetical protein
MNNKLSDFLSFRRMITPLIIQILFWAGVIISVIAGLIMIISGATSDYGGGGEVLIGLLIIVIGPFAVRIWCELLILFFRMNETLSEIRNNTLK